MSPRPTRLPLAASVLALVWVAPLSAAPDPPDFTREGVAFLQKHCVSCHGEKTRKADLALHGYRDEMSLVKDRKRWRTVLDMVHAGEMPPHPRARPTAPEVETFIRSVNLAFERADKNAKPDPGRVTVRRLNRTEYNNTIRDLVGVDFNPAEDFPSDDIGHGFDNIGDVLSLSPVLMERYLAAAESIMQRAIVPDPSKPPVRTQSARYLEPAQQADVKVRPLTAGQGKDSLNTPYRLALDGAYVVRVRASGSSPDQEPPRVALLANGKELAIRDITAIDKREVYEVKVTLPPGDTRFAVTILNPAAGEKTRTVFVEWLQVEGPADTRPLTQRRLLACDASKPKPEQTLEVLRRFASRAYRRPVTDAELDRLVKLVQTVEARGEKWEAGVQLAMQAVLVSPKFLFRVELDDRPDSAEPHPLDEYQLASRLSYFLWSTMPDDELFDLAARKQLTANLDAQVRRMLKDPKAKALVDNFAMQWLQLQRLRTFAPDPKLFPSFNDNLRAAMLGETARFFEAIIKEDRSILDLIDADFTFVNGTLARHYGITLPNAPGGDFRGGRFGRFGGRRGGEEFVRVTLPPGERGGLLTQASVLTVTSNPTRTSPVKRGRWVLEQLLGTPPPPPPPNVPELKDDQKAALTGSLRQRMEQHRANPACASCHAKMDPLGFAFENFDAIGTFRKKDGGFDVDPSGVLPDGRAFKGPAELKVILKEKKDLFARNLAEKMLTYSLGRGVEYYDRPTLDRVTEALAKANYQFSTLAVEIAKSDPFRMRRGKDQR
jgi:hypothetical protein